MKKIIIIIIIIILGLFTYNYVSNQGEQQKNNQENQNNQADIVIENIDENQVIHSPLNISGKAKGSWFFEASAPVVLTDWDGRIIAESHIQVEGDWMTTSFVPFSGVIEFEKPEDIGDYSDRGALILKKANPSGLPENDEVIEITVRFR